MENKKSISVGVVGTSWWADSMYLPALANHPSASLTALCGRNYERAKILADRWQIEAVFVDHEVLIESGCVQALIVATSNEAHYPITMKALEAGLHVLCEKPLALTYAQAREMATLADQKGVKHMVPYTYRYMPTARYVKQLLDEGYLGRPYHLNMRYYTGYGRTGDYKWRFNAKRAGSGAVGDIGSHFLYLAGWYFGEVTGVYAQLGWMVDRFPVDPEGEPYRPTEDTAIIMLTFANGALGVIHASTVAYEATAFGQTHGMEFHGSEGSLHSFTDWDTVQRVSGAREGEGPVRELPIPDAIWGTARRDTVHNTYRDIFRGTDIMAREFITAIAEDTPLSPSFHDGAYVQRLIEAAIMSDRERCWISLDAIS